jgi:hypothetical protein
VWSGTARTVRWRNGPSLTNTPPSDEPIANAIELDRVRRQDLLGVVYRALLADSHTVTAIAS